MKKSPAIFPAAALLLAASLTTAWAATPPDTGAYARAHKWSLEGAALPRSPVPDLAPMHYFTAQGAGQSCSLLARSTSGKNVLIELAGPDDGANWPECMGIESMTAFKMDDRDYVAVVYLVHDTREDFYRYIDFLYADPARGYVVDTDLRGGLAGGHAIPDAVKKLDVAALARAKRTAMRLAPGDFKDEHFIAGRQSWFAVIQDTKAKRCHVVAQAAAAPVTFDHRRFAPNTACNEVLATTRLEKGGATWYLAMFELAGGKRHVGIVSVTPDGRIEAATALAETVNRAGAVKDIRSARAALAKALP